MACPTGADDAQGYYQQPLPPLPPPLDALLGPLYASIGYVSFHPAPPGAFKRPLSLSSPQ